MEKQPVKVVIRTRPTPDFAGKNISIDQTNAVSEPYVLTHFRRWQCQCRRMKRVVWLTTRLKVGNSNMTRSCIMHLKRMFLNTVRKRLSILLLMVSTLRLCAMDKLEQEKRLLCVGLQRTTNTGVWFLALLPKFFLKSVDVTTTKSLWAFRFWRFTMSYYSICFRMFLRMNRVEQVLPCKTIQMVKFKPKGWQSNLARMLKRLLMLYLKVFNYARRQATALTRVLQEVMQFLQSTLKVDLQ